MFDGQLFHPLLRRFDELDASQRRIMHLTLCELALENWQRFCRRTGTIHYVESVCGTQQTVDKGLPAKAFGFMDSGGDALEIDRSYAEPIAALHDGDLVIPEPIAFAYYAIYNGFRKYALHREVDDWLIVNQALSSVEDQAVWAKNLEAAIDKATSAE
ncbi:hypothetical protein [Bremerella sp.]|uniref:hypothetical protein n=1 Tax=Bremerella sp. TaxID=2795602 RepID=UPI00391C07FC